MAHEINRMMYVGKEVPWHGLGRALPANAPYEQIVQAAGFYEALERPLFVAGSDRPVPDRKALVRSDSNAYLSTVGTGYEVVQFRDIARTLVEAASGVQALFHTAGTLGVRGATGWLLGELPEPLIIKGDPSPVRKFILGYGSHTGRDACIVKPVGIRVVCANTLNVGLASSGVEWRIHHCGNPQLRLDEAALAFRAIAKGYERQGELFNVMASSHFSDEAMKSTIERVLPIPDDAKDHGRLEADRARVYRLFHEAVGANDDIQNTAWMALQAWTEYGDHHRSVRASQARGARDARLESIWMGRSAQLKQSALEAIVAEAGFSVAA